MNTLPIVTRLAFAAFAAATTLGLFSAVAANAEPDRSVLMAKVQQHEVAPVTRLAQAPTTVIVAIAAK